MVTSGWMLRSKLASGYRRTGLQGIVRVLCPVLLGASPICSGESQASFSAYSVSPTTELERSHFSSSFCRE